MNEYLIEYLQDIAAAEGRPIPRTRLELLKAARREIENLQEIGCPGIAEDASEREPFSAMLYVETRNEELEILRGGLL